MQTDPSPIERIRRTLRPVRRFGCELRHRWLRLIGRLGGDWNSGLPEELRFWEEALRDPEHHWLCAEYEERMNPDLELQDCLKALIEAPPGATVRLLDVGSGPLTRLGKKWEGRQVELYPVDPLAEEYTQLLNRLGIRPPVFPTACHAEKLTEMFAPDFFDLAYASNSLDHSYEPLGAIRQMLAVTKLHRYVYLWHFAHAGVSEGYSGLHQWNFDLKRGDLILSDGRSRAYSLSAEFRGLAELECAEERFAGERVVIGKLRKLRAS